MKTPDAFPQEQFRNGLKPIPPHFGELDDCIDESEVKISPRWHGYWLGFIAGFAAAAAVATWAICQLLNQ